MDRPIEVDSDSNKDSDSFPLDYSAKVSRKSMPSLCSKPRANNLALYRGRLSLLSGFTL